MAHQGIRRLVNLLLKALRIEPVHDVEHSATPRDLEHIVADSRQTGELPEDLSTLLDRILDFPTRSVEHAMIPRARVDVVLAGEPVRAVLTRWPPVTPATRWWADPPMI